MIDQFIQNSFLFLGQFGYLVLFVTTFFEGVPIIGTVIPGATLAVFAGFLAKEQILSFFLLTIFITLGAFLGDMLGFFVAKKYGYHFLQKYGKYIFFTEARLQKVKHLIEKHPGKSIFFGRFNSFTRSISSFAAGASGVPASTFFPLSFLSAFTWALSHLLVGYIFGKWIEEVSRHIGFLFLGAFLIAFALVYLYRFINQRHHVFKKFHVYTLVLMIFSLFFFSLTLDGVENKKWITEFDSTVTQAVEISRQPWLTDAMLVITRIADPVNIISLISLLVIYLTWKKRYKDASLSLFAISLGAYLQYFIKDMTSIPRPSDSLVDTFYSSFPSGHTTMATIFFTLLIIVFFDSFKKIYIRNIFFVVSVLFILTIGMSRVYVRAHFPSDVLAGFSVGLFSVCFSVLLFRVVVFAKRWLD